MDQKGIPPQIKTVDNRNKKSTFFVCGGDANLILVSYIDKEKNGKRNVVVLTPMHDKIKVTKEEKQKPQVHTFYAHTEVGVNIVNLNFRYILTRMKIKRWAMNYVTFILDTARKNANTILLNNNFKMISHEFTYQFAKCSNVSNVQRRYNSANGLLSNQMTNINNVLGIKDKKRNPLSKMKMTIRLDGILSLLAKFFAISMLLFCQNCQNM